MIRLQRADNLIGPPGNQILHLTSKAPEILTQREIMSFGIYAVGI
jgi:hypothetical protein